MQIMSWVILASAMSRSEFRNIKFIAGLATIVVVTLGYILWQSRAKKP